MNIVSPLQIHPHTAQGAGPALSVLNNPLSAIDPDGLDCVYLNDWGNGLESIDQHSSSSECSGNGGFWIPGRVDASSIMIDDINNQVGAYSRVAGVLMFTASTSDFGGKWASVVAPTESGAFDPTTGLGWTMNYAKAFLWSRTLSPFQSGTCENVAWEGTVAALKPGKSALENAKKLAAPAATAIQAGGVSAQGTIYQATPTLVRWGADRLGLSMLANGVAAASNAGAKLLTGVGSRVGTIAVATFDGALLNGVIDESKAVWNGQCR